jgi:3-dehydroquinate synthase
MKNDKKNESGKIGFALLKNIGNCTFGHYLPERGIIDGLEYYRQNIGYKNA